MIKMNCTDKPPTKQKSKYFLGTIFCHGSVKEFHIQLPVHVHYKGKAYCLILQWRIQRLISAHREREARAWENQLVVCKPPSRYRAEPCWWTGAKPPKNFDDLLVKITFLKRNMPFYET